MRTVRYAKQKTAYEITTRLVGSEMCIRDRGIPFHECVQSSLSWFFRHTLMPKPMVLIHRLRRVHQKHTLVPTTHRLPIIAIDGFSACLLYTSDAADD